MNEFLRNLTAQWPLLLLPTGVFVITLVLGWILRRVLFQVLRRWARNSQHRWDDVLVEVLYGPFLAWVLILAVHLAMQSSELPARFTGFESRLLLILWIISLTMVASRLAGTFVRLYGSGVTGALGMTTLTQNIVSALVAGIGLLILLDTLSISITPILTALGVGGLAVALALQDTLSNLFSGFYVSLAGYAHPGDYVKLDSGEEGYITDISWRSTTLRALANNLIVVPNAKFAQAIVTNFNMPEKRMSLLIPVGVSYDSDIDRVERVLIEEAVEGAKHIQGLLADPPPFVRFIPGFGDSSLDFTLICQVAEFVDQYAAQHEMRKRIFKRFRKEGIEIPFPIRTVHFHNADKPPAEPEATA